MNQTTCPPSPTSTPALYKNATGKLTYTLTNDYLFRATLQESPPTLREVVRSVLGLGPEESLSVEILNPIVLGKKDPSKTFIMDTRVCLNNNTYINLEMQVLNERNWPERSLQYLCRSFDQLQKGESYSKIKPVIQVCFLNFTLFEDIKEFFSTYMFTNIKNHRIYSDKLKLLVVDLTCIDIATEEDKTQQTDYWASLFKATTWEEIHMLATKNPVIEDTAETIYRLNADDDIREQCEAREDFYRQQRSIQEEMKQQLATIVEQDATIAEQGATIAEQGATIAEQGATIAEQDAKLQYMQRSKSLFQALTKDCRYVDLQRAYEDETFLQGLLEEYHL